MTQRKRFVNRRVNLRRAKLPSGEPERDFAHATASTMTGILQPGTCDRQRGRSERRIAGRVPIRAQARPRSLALKRTEYST